MPEFLDASAIGDAVRQVLKRGPRLVAVPYIGPGAPTDVLALLGAGDKVICDASDQTLATGATAPSHLRALLAARVDVYSNGDLHAKVYVGRQSGVVGSYNLSKRAEGNLEAGALLSNQAQVEEARTFVLGLLRHRRTVTVDDAFLQRADAVYRPPAVGQGHSRNAARSLQVLTYGDAVPARVARFADEHAPGLAPNSSEFVDWSVGNGHHHRLGDVVLWVERDGRKRQQSWRTCWPAVCDLKVPLGDADGTWIYYWRYADAGSKPWGDVVKSVAYHARGYELHLDQSVRRADVLDAVFRLFPTALENNSGPSTVETFLSEVGVADLDVLRDRLCGETDLDVEVLHEGEGVSVAFLDRDGAQVEAFEYGVAAAEFWQRLARLEHETRRLQAYCDLGREIEAVEGFPVNFVGAEGDDNDFGPWRYDRAARGNWTLRGWEAKRLRATYGDMAIPVVLRANGGAVRANARLSTLRKLAAAGELLDPQFHAEGWL